MEKKLAADRSNLKRELELRRARSSSNKAAAAEATADDDELEGVTLHTAQVSEQQEGTQEMAHSTIEIEMEVPHTHSELENARDEDDAFPTSRMHSGFAVEEDTTSVVPLSSPGSTAGSGMVLEAELTAATETSSPGNSGRMLDCHLAPENEADKRQKKVKLDKLKCAGALLAVVLTIAVVALVALVIFRVVNISPV